MGVISKQYQNLILFAPSLIKDNKLITQTLSFSVPYRATNLLYITSPKLRYIIIGDSDLAKEVNRTLPSNLNKEFYPPTSIPTIKNENNYKVRFVFFNNLDSSVLTNLEKMRDSDVTAIQVSGDIEQGNIDFYQKDGTDWTGKGSLSYLGKSTLIGAIYADTLETYECNMQNTFTRFNLITQIYHTRTENLTGFTTVEDCINSYNNALSNLDEILVQTSDFENADINAISVAANSLAVENKNLQINSCPLIY